MHSNRGGSSRSIRLDRQARKSPQSPVVSFWRQCCRMGDFSQRSLRHGSNAKARRSLCQWPLRFPPPRPNDTSFFYQITMPGRAGAASPRPYCRQATQNAGTFRVRSNKSRATASQSGSRCPADRARLLKKLPLSRSRTLLGHRWRAGHFFGCFLSPLSAPAGDPSRTSSVRSSGAAGCWRSRYGAASGGRRSGFFSRCSAAADSIPYSSPMFCTRTVPLKTNPCCLSSSVFEPRRAIDRARCVHEPAAHGTRVGHALFRVAVFAHSPRALLWP